MAREAFSDRLNRAMRNTGMTDEDLASAADITKSLINKYLHGTHLPGAVNLQALGFGLHLSLDWLMDCEMVRAVQTPRHIDTPDDLQLAIDTIGSEPCPQ
jgi:transcriptional regulator with XRE-family HTH domain